jgi:quinol monooxygenase YgiN
MPALPWTKGEYRDDTELHVLTSRLPLKRYRDVARFLRWTMRIRRQLRATQGCAGYTLDAKLLTKTFWTLSAWSDKEAMNAFVTTDQHAAMLADMKGRLGKATFVESTARRTDLPLAWRDARERINTASSTP